MGLSCENNDDIDYMINDCINRQSKLSDWEVEFIDTIMDRSTLSPKQLEKLESIWERVTKK